MTLNKMRADGCWIITGRKEVRSYIWRCVVCRKLHSSAVEQKMANLPEDHLEPITASTDSTVDYCGPFTIREGKKEMKGYRVVFTSLDSRTVHHNTSSKLETNAFINALHHLICQRGQIQLSPLLPSAEKFCRKHWGHVQHLANNFLTGCSKSIYLRVSFFSSVRNGQRQGETC